MILSSEQKSRGSFSVGASYERNKNYYIAISPEKLIGIRGGKLSAFKPSGSVFFFESNLVSVNMLLSQWGISINIFDKIMSKMILVPKKEIRVRQKPRTSGKDLIEEWREIRTAKIVEMKP